MEENESDTEEQAYSDGGTTQDTIDSLVSDFRGRLSRIVSEASKGTITASIILGLVIGGLSAWMFANIFGLAPIAFLVGTGVSWRHLMSKDNGWLSSGKGFYIMAVQCFFLAPMFYIPVLFRSSTGEGVEAAGTFVGSILGMFIWEFVFGFIALILVVCGYMLRKRGKKGSDGYVKVSDHESP